MRTHHLKIMPMYFDAVLSGAKTFEVREDDRGFAVGDTLVLREWQKEPFPSFGGDYTGRECKRIATYILSGVEYGLHPNAVVMGLSDPAKDLEIARLRKIEQAVKEYFSMPFSIAKMQEFDDEVVSELLRKARATEKTIEQLLKDGDAK